MSKDCNILILKIMITESGFYWINLGKKDIVDDSRLMMYL